MLAYPYLIPHGHAVWTKAVSSAGGGKDHHQGEIIELGGDAWEWMGWEGIDPDSGRLDRWPAEIFGPVPESKVRYPDE